MRADLVNDLARIAKHFIETDSDVFAMYVNEAISELVRAKRNDELEQVYRQLDAADKVIMELRGMAMLKVTNPRAFQAAFDGYEPFIVLGERLAEISRVAQQERLPF